MCTLPPAENQNLMVVRLRNPDARIKALEKRLEQSPSSAAFFPLASLLWERDEVGCAEALLRNGLAIHPHYAAAGVLLGEILLSKGEDQEALRFIEKALEIAPWNILGQRLFALCHQRKGDEAAAQRALRVADMFGFDEAAAPGAVADSDAGILPFASGSEYGVDAVLTPSLAELYEAQGHLGEARDIYMRLLKAEPANVEWTARLAAIQEQMVQGVDAGEPTVYPEIVANLDLLAGGIKSVEDGTAEIKADAIVPEDTEVDEGDEEDVVEREDADSILMKMIDLYIEEGNDAQALDVCQKVLSLGRRASWVFERILALEGKMVESATPLLREFVENDKDESVSFLSLADQQVVEILESWLETLQRCKVNG